MKKLTIMILTLITTLTCVFCFNKKASALQNEYIESEYIDLNYVYNDGDKLPNSVYYYYRLDYGLNFLQLEIVYYADDYCVDFTLWYYDSRMAEPYFDCITFEFERDFYVSSYILDIQFFHNQGETHIYTSLGVMNVLTSTIFPSFEKNLSFEILPYYQLQDTINSIETYYTYFDYLYYSGYDTTSYIPYNNLDFYNNYELQNDFIESIERDIANYYKGIGLENGYNNGYTDGLYDGESKGLTASTKLKDLFFDIVDAPRQAIQNMLNFEIFGINISSIVLFLISTALVVAVIKYFI